MTRPPVSPPKSTSSAPSAVSPDGRAGGPDRGGCSGLAARPGCGPGASCGRPGGPARRAGRTGALELGDRVARGRLGQDEARVVGLGSPGEAELPADLQQLVAVVAVPG